jgi:hypothetical protein
MFVVCRQQSLRTRKTRKTRMKVYQLGFSVDLANECKPVSPSFGGAKPCPKYEITVGMIKRQIPPLQRRYNENTRKRILLFNKVLESLP